MRNLIGDWKVKKIEVEEDGSIFVTRARKTEMVRIVAPHFGIGRKGKKVAALAKFVARHSLGEARRLYRFLSTMPRDFIGELPLSFPDHSANSASAIDDDAPMDTATAESWAAIDEADKLDISKAEHAALNRKILLSAIFSVDVDGVIGSLTGRPGRLKIVKSDDVNARLNSRPDTSTTTID